MTFGGYKTMWVVVLFDLPTDDDQARRDYTKFRKHLLNNGFSMMQYSVYMRHCASDENAQVHTRRIRSILPPNGEVRIMKITDKQFGRIEVYFGKKPVPVEKAPEQLQFF